MGGSRARPICISGRRRPRQECAGTPIPGVGKGGEASHAHAGSELLGNSGPKCRAAGVKGRIRLDHSENMRKESLVVVGVEDGDEVMPY